MAPINKLIWRWSTHMPREHKQVTKMSKGGLVSTLENDRNCGEHKFYSEPLPLNPNQLTSAISIPNH